MDFVAGCKSVESVPKLVSDYVAKKFCLHALVSYTLPFDKNHQCFWLYDCRNEVSYQGIKSTLNGSWRTF